MNDLLEEEKKDEKMLKVNLENTSLENGLSEGKTLERIEKESNEKKQIKNLIAIVIFLIGLFGGSLFVDFIQLFLGDGYSKRALEKTDIFESGKKTWVAFSDPAVTVKVLSLKDEELKDCLDCDPTEFLLWMKKFLPTLVVKKVLVDSEEGKKIIEKFDIKNIPAFIFDNKIENTDFFSQEGIKTIFEKKEGSMVLNKNLMGIPAGKFLKFPEISANDNFLGNKDALKVIVFSDFQCPYSKKIFTSLKTLIQNGYQDKVAFVLKNLPAEDIHPMSKNAAKIAFCANNQGKFWETAQWLFDKQDQWGKAKDIAYFKNYYRIMGLEEKKMTECLEENKAEEKLSADANQAMDFSLTGTPSGFIGKELFGGALETDELKSILDKQLEK